jgi:hypothetical protein
MALRHHLKRWVRRLLKPGSNALKLHDSLEERFSEVKADLAQVDADTVLDKASTEGLDRWGIDLAEPRLPNQSDDQYRSMLKAIKQGKAVNEEGVRYALDRWGLTYQLLEFGDASTFWDRGFYDRTAVSVPARQIVVIFGDPFPGITPTAEQKADARQRATNAVRDVNRVKARGVNIVAILPGSLQ